MPIDDTYLLFGPNGKYQQYKKQKLWSMGMVINNYSSHVDYIAYLHHLTKQIYLI